MAGDDVPNPTDSFASTSTQTSHRAAWRQFRWRMLAGILCYTGGHPDLIRYLASVVNSRTGIDLGFMEIGLPFLLAMVIGIMGARLRDASMMIVAIALMSLGRIHFRSLTGRHRTIDTSQEIVEFLIGTIPYYVVLMIPTLVACCWTRHVPTHRRILRHMWLRPHRQRQRKMPGMRNPHC